MVPLTIGFLISGPLSGIISDRLGSTRPFTVGGPLVVALSFGLLMTIPADFTYWEFALLLFLFGIGSGTFMAPNRAEIMNGLPADQRGAGAGMTATFMNAATVLSIGIFFSLIVAGLSRSLPSALYHGLTAQDVPSAAATSISKLPALGVLFAAFLGYNPMKELLGPVSSHLPADKVATMTGHSFFPELITGPFHDGLVVAFWFAVVASVVAAIASFFTGKRTVVYESPAAEVAINMEPPEAELAWLGAEVAESEEGSELASPGSGRSTWCTPRYGSPRVTLACPACTAGSPTSRCAASLSRSGWMSGTSAPARISSVVSAALSPPARRCVATSSRSTGTRPSATSRHHPPALTWRVVSAIYR
jgi:MFS family permease